MNTTHIVDKLRDFDLNGMVGAIEHHGAAPAFADLPFQDRLMHFLQAEAAYRDDRRLKRILKSARLKIPAAAEDIDYRSARNLDRAHMAELPTCAWVRQAENLILTGATGTGKTHLACAFGGHAARVGLTVRYYRTHQLLGDMAIAHQDGSLGRLRMSLTRFDLLILDDFGLTPLTELGKHDLLDVVDARTRSASILLAGQLSFKEWHAYIAVRLRSPALTSAPVIGCPELCPLHSTSRQLRDELLNEALFRSPRSMLEASGGADLHLRIVSTRCSNPALTCP